MQIINAAYAIGREILTMDSSFGFRFLVHTREGDVIDCLPRDSDNLEPPNMPYMIVETGENIAIIPESSISWIDVEIVS